MTDYRALFDRDYIGAWDLEGRDTTVTIERVEAGELVGEGGRKTKKPIIAFVGKTKKFIANVTNCRTISTLYGPKVEAWKGKRITLYPTVTRDPKGSGDVECIRVRPREPTGATQDLPGAASQKAE